MQTDTSAPTNSGYAAEQPTKAPPWHGLVAWDLLFNGMTTGLFLVAAISELAKPDVFAPIAKAAFPVALVLLIVDLLFLVLDLGDPLRFHHMLRVFKPSSPMSLGTWCLTLYSLPLTAVVAIDLMPEEGMALSWVHRIAVLLGLLPALGSSVYKGVLLSTSSQPGWKDARWLGGYLAGSALVLGCAEMVVLSVLMKQEQAAGILRPAFGLLLVLNAIPLCLLLVELGRAVSRLPIRRPFRRVTAISLIEGVLIPLGLLAVGDGPLLLLVAVSFLFLGSLVIRIALVKLPHTSR